MQRLTLIACSKAKLPHAAQARDLYQGDLFRKARAWAEKRGARWLILSARHGLVQPQHWLAPYNETLADLPRSQRFHWGERVRAQLDALDQLQQPLEILAGRAYRGAWTVGLDVTVPLAGLGIGAQKARLAAMLKGGAA
jgi:hypothetical protein